MDSCICSPLVGANSVEYLMIVPEILATFVSNILFICTVCKKKSAATKKKCRELWLNDLNERILSMRGAGKPMRKASFKSTSARNLQPGFMVNALVLDQSILNLLVSSRNIVDFFVESLSELIGKERSPASVVSTASQCRSSMEKLLSSADGSLENAVVLILKEFLMEVDSVRRILDENSSCPRLTTDVMARVEGKTYKARYLSNVLGNEISDLRKKAN